VAALRAAQLDVRANYDAANNAIALLIGNSSATAANTTVVARYTGQNVKITVGPGASTSVYFSLVRFSGWYDLVITLASDASIRYHVAGHLETGKPSISDPAIGGLIL
jgi:phospholipase C